MLPFQYLRADSANAAVKAVESRSQRTTGRPDGETRFLAGGTTLIDLMKLQVMRPERLVDINPLVKGQMGQIRMNGDTLILGSMVKMAEAADHPQIRPALPMLAQSLQLAASAQIRNMASLGGNVLQRTRCTYFRDVSYTNCNKRMPGSGCAALEGFNRAHAVLGASGDCIASYPGDFGQALIALDARVQIAGPKGHREVAFSELHRPPAQTPHIETSLAPDELIMSFTIPVQPWMRRSMYLKIRDRESYEFALASAAVALELDGSAVRTARIALGGVATVPWRARDAEDRLIGKTVSEAAEAAATAAFANARGYEHNSFKIELGKTTLIRALTQTAAMDV